MGIFSAARAAGLPIVSALFPIPKIALLPLLILWFGIGEPSKVATIALGVFFPTVISAYSACDSVPRNLIRMAQSFGLPATDIVAKIILPGAMPGILAGFRISASVALLLVVAAEMIGAQYGIGAFVLHRRQPDADRPAAGRRGHAVGSRPADRLGPWHGRAFACCDGAERWGGRSTMLRRTMLAAALAREPSRPAGLRARPIRTSRSP